MGPRKRFELAMEASSGEGTIMATAEKVAALPGAFKRHFEACGYAGADLPLSAEPLWANVVHRSTEAGRFRPVGYRHFVSAREMRRLALVTAGPALIEERFEGGAGSWRLTLLGLFSPVSVGNTVEVNKSALATFLSEFALLPAALFAPGLELSRGTARAVEARLSAGETSVAGTFHFGEDGLLESFETGDRYNSPDGAEYVRMDWIGRIGGYARRGGAAFPSRFTASWREGGREWEYFGGDVAGYAARGAH